jgi:hypothetical protein
MISTLNETLDSADLNSERSFEINWCKFETKLWIQLMQIRNETLESIDLNSKRNLGTS